MGRKHGARWKVLVGLVAAALALVPPGASGQRLPTLRELGAEAVSADGRFQVTLSGRLDLEALLPSDSTFGLARAERDGGFVAPRIRLFTDVFLGERVYGLVEVRGDRGEAPRAGDPEIRVEQAFLRVSSGSGRVSVQVGRFASPFGTYPQRHLTALDPFVRPPLLYDYRTMMCPGIAPPNTTAFLTWRDRPDEFREIGAPPVWDVPYQWGAMVAGVVGRVAYRVAAVNSAPSSAPGSWSWDADRMKHPSWVAGVGVSVSPAWTVGASFSRGPWLEPLKQGSFPGGKDRWDYLQTLSSVDVTYARGPLVIRAEGIRDRWDVPNMPQAPVELGGNLEIQADVSPGIYLAGRAGLLDFRPVEDGAGTRDWDWDVRRYDLGAGYRLDRNAGIQASWSFTTRRSSLERSRSLLAARVWWEF